MNEEKKTAGETATEIINAANYQERKNYMLKCLAESDAAFLVYADENGNICTMGIAGEGYESAILSMLDVAANKARTVADEAML